MKVITKHNRAILEAISNNVEFSYIKVCYLGKPSTFDTITL